MPSRRWRLLLLPLLAIGALAAAAVPSAGQVLIDPAPPPPPEEQAETTLAPTEGTTDPGEEVEDAGVEMAVSGGVAGRFKPGLPVPLVISVRAEQLITGTIRVQANTDATALTVEVPVEVPGGSTKQWVVSVPTSPWNDAPVAAVLVGDDGETVLGRQSVRLRYDGGAELVGVLPLLADAATLPESVALAVDAGSAFLQGITADWLAVGPQGLRSLDAIVATAADIEALGARERGTLMAWVAEGGHLLVDETSGPVPGLPDEWQPEPGQPARAGGGLVRLSGGLAKAGRWDEMFVPTATSVQREEGMIFQGIQFGAAPLSTTLGEDAGFRLPELPWLIAILLAYVLLAGPLAYVVLRVVRKPTLLWVVVPGLALVFTGAVYLGGTELRRNTDLAHATYVVSNPSGGRATTHVLVSSRSGGHEGLDLPLGWSPTTQSGWFGYIEASGVTATSTGDGFAAGAGLDAGQFLTVSATGWVDDVALEAEAEVDGDEVVGIVTNRLEVPLHEVAVISGSAVVNLGTVPAGGTAEFRLTDLQRMRFPSDIERRTWPAAVRDAESGQCCDEFGRPFPNRDRAEDDPVNLSVWAEEAIAGGTNHHPAGDVMVVGWTRGLDAPVRALGGEEVSEGRTAVATRAAIRSPEDRVLAPSVRREIVRGPDDTDLEVDVERPDGDPFGQDIDMVFGFTLPRVSDGMRLGLRVPDWIIAVEVWAGGRWQVLDPGVGDGERLMAVPEGAVVHGSVFARVQVDPNLVMGGGGSRTDLALYELAPDEQALPPIPVPEDDGTEGEETTA